MKAMIFAAGLGTRLRPFTNNHPKALAPIAGKPALQWVIEKIISFGINDIVVNVHHFADQIIDFINYNHNFGVSIHVSDESDILLDTGGGLLKARKWLESSDDILVHNADIFTNFDILEMTKEHVRSKAIATLLCSHRDTSRYLLFDNEHRMHGWTNIKTGDVKPASLHDIDRFDKMAFGGVHILSPQIFKYLNEYAVTLHPFSIMDFYIDSCDNILISGYCPSQSYDWIDIGKIENLELADKIAKSIQIK